MLSERPITRSEVVISARVVGGLRQIDHGAADDKIIAVLYGDNIWGDATDLEDIPERLIERLQHYFATYKLIPGDTSPIVVQEIYGAAHAEHVVTAAMEDYQEKFGVQ